jgi:uncharacterized protein
MPTRENSTPGAPCWVDLMTSDTAGSRAFYCELFGWTAEEAAEEFGGYFSFLKDGERIAGCMPAQPGQGMPDVWSIYLTTDDARKTVDAAGANGGQVVVEPMTVADQGTMAFVSDSGGAGIGIWQPDVHKGFGVTGEPGTPSWFELWARDYEGAVAFYREVFRWDAHTMSDSDELRYTTLGDAEHMQAGIMDASAFLPEGVPAHWSVYFGVADADAALAKVVELGGSIVQPAEDTPYGRLATAADPSGAQFKLIGPNAAMPARESAS